MVRNAKTSVTKTCVTTDGESQQSSGGIPFLADALAGLKRWPLVTVVAHHCAFGAFVTNWLRPTSASNSYKAYLVSVHGWRN
jgi:hypothetical protein